MSDNNNNNEKMFDLWLTANLKTDRPTDALFSQNIMRQIEYMNAQEILQQAIQQERKAKTVLILTVVCGVAMLCCPPVLRGIYLLLESSLVSLIQTLIEPTSSNVGNLALVFVCLCFLCKGLWDKLTSEI